MHRDRDFDADGQAPVNGDALAQDLELGSVIEAMAAGDGVLRQVARAALLASLCGPDEIRYRQGVLTDALRHPAVVRGLYTLATETIDGEKSIFRTAFSDRPEPLLNRSVEILELFVAMLRRLRRLSDEHAGSFTSEGFRRFFQAVGDELGDGYFDVIERHLKELHFRDGLLMSAHLGEGAQGTDYVLREPRVENRGFFKRASVKKPAYSLTIPERDQAGFTSLSRLRDRGLSNAANSASQAAAHILSFFTTLRAELAFYVGCTNLYETLTSKGEQLCLPVTHDVRSPILSARGLYDPCLSLRVDEPVTGNDLDADGRSLIVITGANQGGKSTFLRSIGVAQLMMQCGMFVAADSFSASASRGVFTHYKREEDATMTSRKLDEELGRMSEIADHIRPGALLLCNESFAATNEREGSHIGSEVVRALTDGGVRVCFVTHLFDLASGMYEQHQPTDLFLRAERHDDGDRTFRLSEGAPLPTSHGADLFRRIFAAPPGAETFALP